MSTAFSLVAALLYLAPVAAIVLTRARRATGPADVAIAIPFAVATDLLVLLALAFVVRVEIAAYVSRALWLSVFVATARARGQRWPLDRRATALALAGAALALAVSLALSRPYAIWDRHWHTPLAASLRGQTLPFSNVFDPREPLKYHFTGDALAAVLASLSFGIIHASLALSLAHDVLFALTGATVALLAVAFGARAPLALAGVLAVLLAGPATVLAPAEPAVGYSVVNYLSLSFRPHVSLAGLLLVGFLGALLVRALQPLRAGAPRTTAIALVAMAAVLAITDEPSLGLCGIALGTAWLTRPEILAPGRRQGAAILTALLAAFVLANVVFAGALSSGTPVHRAALVAWRVPGFYQAPLPLASRAAKMLLFRDVAPIAFVVAGGAVDGGALRGPKSGAAPVLLAALAAASIVALTRIDLNQQPLESHRFATAAMVAAPLFAVAWLAQRPPWAHRIAPFLGRTLLAVGPVLGAVSTIDWARSVAPSQCERRHGFFLGDDFYRTNCRRDAGARLAERPTLRYVAKRVSYAYAGCHPSFILGTAPNSEWGIRMDAPAFGSTALAEIDARLSADDVLPVECPTGTAITEEDPVCRFAKLHVRCARRGAAIVECPLTADARRAALRLP